MKNWDDMIEELFEVLHKYNATLAEVYWTIAVDDALQCSIDTYNDHYPTPEQFDEIVDRLCTDDEMWDKIHTDIYYHTDRVLLGQRSLNIYGKKDKLSL